MWYIIIPLHLIQLRGGPEEDASHKWEKWAELVIHLHSFLFQSCQELFPWTLNSYLVYKQAPHFHLKAIWLVLSGNNITLYFSNTNLHGKSGEVFNGWNIKTLTPLQLSSGWNELPWTWHTWQQRIWYSSNLESPKYVGEEKFLQIAKI